MRDHLFTHTHTLTDECLCGPTIPPPPSFLHWICLGGRNKTGVQRSKKYNLHFETAVHLGFVFKGRLAVWWKKRV